MTTSEVVLQRALELARGSAETESAVTDLLTRAEGRRVSLVLARQQLLADTDRPEATRAIELLDVALTRLPAV